MDNINDILQKIGIFLSALATTLGALWQLVKSLKPAINFLAFLGTQIIPNGFIVWFWLYHAALNANRLTEPAVFFSLAGEELAVLVIYNFFWAFWLYPRIKFLLPKSQSKEKAPSGKKPERKKTK